jgi:hypothetical protein
MAKYAKHIWLEIVYTLAFRFYKPIRRRAGNADKTPVDKTPNEHRTRYN